jgi:cell division protein FtsI/penicillin-binding protein 2
VSRRWLIALVVVVLVVVVAGGGTGAVLYRKHQRVAAQRAAAESFASAWRNGTLATLTYATGGGSSQSGAAVAAAAQKITAGLTSATKDRPTTVTVTGVSSGSDSATASLKVTWTLTGNRAWTYSTAVQILRVGSRWLPDYTAHVIHPSLTTGTATTLATGIREPKRGEIIGADGEVLVTERPVVTVGIERSRATDVDATVSQVASITGVDGAALLKRVKAASATAFVQVIVLREAAYGQVRDQLQPIPGAVFQTGTLSLAPTSDFARALIGTVGPATADAVKAAKGRVQAGEETGLSGLQQAYDEQLGGTPGLVVRAVKSGSSSSSTTTSSGDSAGSTLFSVAAVDGKPLHVTLDEKIQKAAEQALTHATKPAAIVAVQPGTGAVLAVANGGPNASGYDRALLGQYPPGSTFKVATTKALLGAGITPNTTVNCPATVNVGGRTFKNAEAEKFGAVKFSLDFANSCNTAFIGSSSKITQAQLAAAARSLGYGQPNKLGITAFTGQVPTGGDAVSHAASMIGQSTILTSPVTVAGASAAVASGAWNAPRLVLAGDEKLSTNGSGSIAISKSQAATLKELMRDVVTEGTATALRSTPGGPVYGKTGTAEFGNADPPQTHAWFTGWQGDVAFACVVEDGGFGAKAAVPLIKDFLTTLAA